MGACSIRIPICQFSSYPQQAPGIVSSLVGHTIDSTLLQRVSIPTLPPFQNTKTLLIAVLGKIQTNPSIL